MRIKIIMLSVCYGAGGKRWIVVVDCGGLSQTVSYCFR